MIHPLLRLAATEPHLLGEHVEAYAALIGEEASKVGTSWATRVGLYLGALAMLTLGLILVGVSLLLFAAIPAGDMPARWAMFVVPATPLVGAAICIAVARARPIEKAFDNVRKQLNADMAVLREVGT